MTLSRLFAPLTGERRGPPISGETSSSLASSVTASIGTTRGTMTLSPLFATVVLPAILGRRAK
jgi:hypothetical protein